MSTPLYLLLSLPVGLAIFGLVWLLGKLLDPLIGLKASTRRLQRRLARGEDLYFEELRSIETAIERNERWAAQPSRNWRRWPNAALLLLIALWLGALAFERSDVFGLGPAPAWTGYLGIAAIAVVGLSVLVEPTRYNFKNPRTAGVVGGLFVAFGTLAFTLEASHIP